MTDYFGKPACLAQSPQLYKQMAAACGGLGRVMEVCPCHEEAFGRWHVGWSERGRGAGGLLSTLRLLRHRMFFPAAVFASGRAGSTEYIVGFDG